MKLSGNVNANTLFFEVMKLYGNVNANVYNVYKKKNNMHISYSYPTKLCRKVLKKVLKQSTLTV